MVENNLLHNLDKLHTTDMGIDRIKRNLQIDTEDVVKYCHDLIINADTHIERKGKNWYVYFQDMILIVNAYSYTIITAHKNKK